MRTATVYNFLLEANLMASLAILLMLPIRKFLRSRLGNRALYFAWLLVAIRLLCPLALPNPAINDIRPNYANDQAIRPIASQLKIRFSDASQEVLNQAGAQPIAKQLNEFVDSTYNGMLSYHLMQIYAIGAALVLCWFAVSNLRFRHRLRADRIEPISGKLLEQYEAMCRQRGVKPIPVYFTDPLPSACLVGVLRPYIALPLTAAPQEAIQVLTHEVCHYRGRDHLWALLRLLCCVVHWFNPLVWLAARMSRTDCELACDDRVIEKLDSRERIAYANVLVLAAARRDAPGVAVLATGMTMTGRKLKTRINAILHSDNVKKGLSVAFSLMACVLLLGAFATAEYKPVPAIPDASGFAASPQLPIGTDDELIARAKSDWSSSFMQGALDLSTADWEVSYDASVTAITPDEVTMYTSYNSDGMLYWLDDESTGWPESHSVTHYYDEENDPAKLEPLIAYLHAFLNKVAPQLTPYVSEIHYTNELAFRNNHFVEFTASLGGYDSDVELSLQVEPTVRVVHYAASQTALAAAKAAQQEGAQQ